MEVSARWTPELSAWKTAKVLSFDAAKQLVAIEYQLPAAASEPLEEGQLEEDEGDLHSFSRRMFGMDVVTEVDLSQLQDTRLLSEGPA